MMTSEGRAVLTDFGLAAVLEETRLTMDGTSAGTPSYMAPEQAAGERGDQRSDMYSLGVLCYRLLAGELPFHSETLVGMINKVLSEPAPSLRDTVPDLPPHVIETVERALAKDPRARFESVDEMTAALRGESMGAVWSAAARGEDVAAPATARSSAPNLPSVATPPATPIATRLTSSFLGVAAIVTLAVGAAWWTFGRADGGTAEQTSGGSGEPTAVESMVPKVESMVADGDTTVPSMAVMTGWVDGFDENVRGWELSSGDISRSLVDRHYEIDLTIGGQAVSAVAEAGGEFTNLQYSGSGSLVEGQPESGYGLVFRRRDARNYYVFAVNGLGPWSVWALDAGVWRELRGSG